MKSSLLGSALLGCLCAAFSTGCSDGGADANGGTGGSGGSGGTGDTTSRTIAYDDPNIAYSGRIRFVEGEPPRFSAPAVSVTLRFKGVGVSMLMNDNAGSANYFDVVIDGDYENTFKIRPDSSGTTLLLENLRYGEHELKLVKRTEASSGNVDFEGFIVQGEVLPPAAPLTRKIEIIGDSISAGSGNEAPNGSLDCDTDYGRGVSNANQSYGPKLARTLNAEYHVTAVSGIGALRNYNCTDPNTMPTVYGRVLLEDANSPAWEHSQFEPDAILVALGTNDFSPADCKRPPLDESSDPQNYAAFLGELGGFVTTLRGTHPAAEIFLIASPMLNDGWPNANYFSSTNHRAALTTVTEEFNAAGDDKVHVVLSDFSTTRYSGRGCGSHPNVFEHGIVAGLDSVKTTDPAPAELLLNPIKDVMGW